MMELETLHRGYEEWYGQPDYELSFHGDDANKIPSPLDILYYFPREEEENYITSVATVGMSIYEMDEPCKNAELIIDVVGRQSRDDSDRLGNELANLIWNHFQKGLRFSPNMVMRDISLPLFDNMSCLFVMDWGEDSPEWLPDVETDVRLLKIVPIYESEANSLEEIEQDYRTAVFVQAIGNSDDPQRNPVSFFNEAISSIWKDIEDWYRVHAPVVYQDLREGATPEKIEELENQIGLVLPEDLKVSLMLHNGSVGFHDYRYLTTEGIYRNWSRMNELKEEGVFSQNTISEVNEGIIKNTWWNSHWIPFAEDSGGNMICIDLSPEENGYSGQIIYMEMQEGPIISEYKSFFEWLQKYKKALYRGEYIVDEYGYIEEK